MSTNQNSFCFKASRTDLTSRPLTPLTVMLQVFPGVSRMRILAGPPDVENIFQIKAQNKIFRRQKGEVNRPSPAQPSGLLSDYSAVLRIELRLQKDQKNNR